MTATWHAEFAAALLDPDRRLPAGLVAWNGSDVTRRFAVYRNNVTVSLVDALGETFPVVRQLVGEDFFRAMARTYVRTHPPASPVLALYGEGFGTWLAGFEPVQALPYLPDMARLEYARVAAYHAADAAPLSAEALATRWADAAALPASRLVLHPSCQLLGSVFAVRELWAAHQIEGDWPAIEIHHPNATLVLRDSADDVLVIGLDGSAARFIGALLEGASFGVAAQCAGDVGLAATLALLIRHAALVAWDAPEHPS